MLRDTNQESNVVTKAFDVSEALDVNAGEEAGGQSKPDDYIFLNELKHEVTKVGFLNRWCEDHLSI